MDAARRSWIMSRIRSRSGLDNRVMKWLEDHGVAFIPYPFGTRGPDVFIIPSGKFVYLDGCFWHRCPKHFRWPKTNRAFWMPKIRANVTRDRARERCSIRVWEHEVGPDGRLPARVFR